MAPVLARALAAPPREWVDVVAVGVTAVVVELGLRLLGLRRLSRLLGVPLGDGEPGATIGTARPATSTHVRRQLRATRRVMRRWPWGDTCLRQSLVLGRRLRRLRPTLEIGVADVHGELRAHAWLEIGGEALDTMWAAADYLPLRPVGPADP